MGTLLAFSLLVKRKGITVGRGNAPNSDILWVYLCGCIVLACLFMSLLLSAVPHRVWLKGWDKCFLKSCPCSLSLLENKSFFIGFKLTMIRRNSEELFEQTRGYFAILNECCSYMHHVNIVCFCLTSFESLLTKFFEFVKDTEVCRTWSRQVSRDYHHQLHFIVKYLGQKQQKYGDSWFNSWSVQWQKGRKGQDFWLLMLFLCLLSTVPSSPSPFAL